MTPGNTYDRWCEKTPRNILFFDRIIEFFQGRVRFVQIIRDNQRVVQGICAFLDLPYGPETVDWHKHAKVRENSALGGEVKPLFGSSIGKWKKPEHAQRVAELLANPEARHLLRELGYLE